MNGYYGVSTWLTYLNMISGVLGISYALSRNITLSMACLVIAGVCDMFDGTVARQFDRTRDQKSYGIQIDALADMVSFGLLPGAIGLALGLDQFPWVLVVALYALAALIRLAYYNVTEQAFLAGGQGRVYYEGLPVTSVAAIIPLIYLLSLFLEFSLYPAYGVFLGVFAVAFVSKFHIRKLKLRHMILLGAVSVPAVIVLVVRAVR